jgi:Flavodoxin-like fold
MSKRILLMQAHPDASQPHRCRTLASSYAKGAESEGHTVRHIVLAQGVAPRSAPTTQRCGQQESRRDRGGSFGFGANHAVERLGGYTQQSTLNQFSILGG